MAKKDTNDLEIKLSEKRTAASYLKGQRLETAIDSIQNLESNLDMGRANALDAELKEAEEKQKEVVETRRQNYLATASANTQIELSNNSQAIIMFSPEKQQALSISSMFLDDFLTNIMTHQEQKAEFKKAALEFEVLKVNDKGETSEEFKAMETRYRLEKLRENPGIRLKSEDELALATTKKELDAEIRLHKDEKAVKLADNKVSAGVGLQRGILGGIKVRDLKINPEHANHPDYHKHLKNLEHLNAVEEQMRDAGEVKTKGLARVVGLLSAISAFEEVIHKKEDNKKSMVEKRLKEAQKIEEAREKIREETQARDKALHIIGKLTPDQEKRAMKIKELEEGRKSKDAAALQAAHEEAKLEKTAKKTPFVDLIRNEHSTGAHGRIPEKH